MQKGCPHIVMAFFAFERRDYLDIDRLHGTGFAVLIF